MLEKVQHGLLYLFVAFSVISIAGTQSALALLVVIWISRMIRDRHWQVVRTPMDAVFGAFVAACVIASIFSVHPAESFRNLKNVLLIVLVYMIASNVVERRQIERVVQVLVTAAAAMAMVGLLSTDIMGGNRVMGLQSTTMTWGSMSAIFSIVTISIVLFGPGGKGRFWYGLAFLAQFVGMLFSYVRGAWLGFIAGLFVLAFLKSRKLIGAIVLFLIVTFLLSPPAIKERIRITTDLNVGSTQVRFTQWKNSINIIKDHPITGVGWIDLGEIHRAYAPPGADLNFQAYRIGHFHNNYVMLMVCLGAIGFIAALVMVGRIIWFQYRAYQNAPPGDPLMTAVLSGCLAAFIAFWINGFFDWTFGDAEPVTLLWLTVGLSISIQRIWQRTPEQA